SNNVLALSHQQLIPPYLLTYHHVHQALPSLPTRRSSDLVDGQPLTLKKIYKEKYTKKRGQATAEFTGHETNHYIDDVPVKKKEYEDKIKSLVDEEVFKLITSPTYFNEALKWQDRRKTLLE